MADIYYRLADRLLWEDGRMVVDLQEYRVIRRTPKGAWIGIRNPWGVGFGRDRFVLDGPGRRWAYPTKKAALESFLIRKRRQIQHLERQLLVARAALKGAEAPGFEPDKAFHDETLEAFHEY